MTVSKEEGYFTQRLEVAKRQTVEIIREDELTQLVQDVIHGKSRSCYVGYEPTSRVHIGWLTWMFKLRDLQDVGFQVYVLEAVWHAWINDKGTLDEIDRCREKVRKVLEKMGVYAKYVDGYSIVQEPDYIKTLLRAAKMVSLDRVRRAVTVAQRKVDEVEQDFSKILYPLLQAVDAVYLNVDLALGGVDQKPAFLMARDVAMKLTGRVLTIMCTPIISGLKTSFVDFDGIESEVELYAMVKMSSSRPDDAIFLDDSPEVVEQKISKAECPPRQVKFNPVLDIMKYVILPYYRQIEIETSEGTVSISSEKTLDDLYAKGLVTPETLKRICIDYLVKMLEELKVE